MYKVKVAVCSDISTKHSTLSECHVEFLNFKPWWYVKKPLGFKRLRNRITRLTLQEHDDDDDDDNDDEVCSELC